MEGLFKPKSSPVNTLYILEIICFWENLNCYSILLIKFQLFIISQFLVKYFKEEFVKWEHKKTQIGDNPECE